MSIDRLLDEVEAHRNAGTLDAPGDRGNNSDMLVGRLWDAEDRSQLDRLVAGLPDGEAVADRAEQALRLKGAVPASDDDIETWGYACLEEWVALARRRSDGPVLEAFEALGNMAVEVVDSAEHSDEASFRLNGSLLGTPAADADSELTADQLVLLHGEGFELLAAEMSDGRPAGWGGLEVLFQMALEDEPSFGGWLLSPAASWEFNFEPFYNLWRAGVSLWVSPDMIEAVTGTAIWGDSSFGRGPAAPAVLSNADAKWAQNAGPHADKVLALVAAHQSPRGGRLELINLDVASLPPALVVEGGWTLLDIEGSPGLDPARLSELDRLELLVLRACELAWFDIALPPGLKRISLYKNHLTQWPGGVAAAGSELVRLDLQYNQLSEVPNDVGALTALQDLSLADNNITTISPAIGELSNLENLALATNRDLATLPQEILELPTDCRISLRATALPDSFHKVKTIGQLRDVWVDLPAV